MLSDRLSRQQRTFRGAFALAAVGSAALAAAAACSSGNTPTNFGNGTTSSSNTQPSASYGGSTSQSASTGPNGATGATSAATTSAPIGTGSGTATATSTGDSKCVTAVGPTLINFDSYNPTGDAGFSTYFGSGTSVGYIGTYGYSGGGPDGGPNYAITPVTGRSGGTVDGAQDWAVDFSLDDESVYGGALGFWMSCINANAYHGISFWARGQTPLGTCARSGDAGGGSCFALTLGTAATALPTDGGVGVCPGTSSTCVAPQAANLAISNTWTQYQIPWSSFTGGSEGGTAYTPDGSGIVGFSFVLSLAWTTTDASAPDGAAIYVPTPASMDLQVDDVGFY